MRTPSSVRLRLRRSREHKQALFNLGERSDCLQVWLCPACAALTMNPLLPRLRPDGPALAATQSSQTAPVCLAKSARPDWKPGEGETAPNDADDAGQGGQHP